jgi:predicted dienelactone hydrolase
MKPSAVLRLAVLLSALAAAWPAHADQPQAPGTDWRPDWPTPEGSYPTGTVTADWPHTTESGDSRRLKIQLWYPAAEDASGPRAPYLQREEAEDITAAIAGFLGLDPSTADALGAIETHSVIAVRPAADGPFPLVLFSHGYWFYVQQSTALMETLASRGYIVASVAHPGDSMPVSFADGTTVQTVPFTPPSKEERAKSAEAVFWSDAGHDARVSAYPAYQEEEKDRRVQKSLIAWRQDVTAVLDDLIAGSVPTELSNIIASMDFGHVAFAGMSFGGAVAASACHTEPRCKAAVNMDGFQFDRTLFNTRIRMPLLMLNNDWVNLPSEGRPNTPEFTTTDYFYEAMADAGRTADMYRVRVVGFRHLGFTDLPLFLDHDALGAPGSRATVFSVNRATVAFLDRYLKGHEEAFPGDIFSTHPELIQRAADDVRLWHNSLQKSGR